MPYTATTVAGERVHLKTRFAETPESLDGVESLLQAASPAYNRALEALDDRDIPTAFEAAEHAVSRAPFCARFVEFNLLIALQHGDFERARALISWSAETGMQAEWPAYGDYLIEAINAWNDAVGAPDTLNRKYGGPTDKASYRELLLLADWARTGEHTLGDAQQRVLEAYGVPFDMRAPSSNGSIARSARWGWRLAGSTVFASVIGLLIGFILWGEMNPSSETVAEEGQTDQTEEMVSLAPARADAIVGLAQANLALARGYPDSAHVHLEGQRASELSDDGGMAYAALREATNEALFEAGVTAWRSGDYSSVIDYLHPIRGADIGDPQQKYYFLGMSAYEEGRDSLATASLRELQNHLDADHPHYEAQAAYALVRLLPESEAQEFAQLIAARYPETPYFNSVVREVL